MPCFILATSVTNHTYLSLVVGLPLLGAGSGFVATEEDERVRGFLGGTYSSPELVFLLLLAG